MAIQLSWQSDQIGATFPNAYASIVRFGGTVETTRIVVVIHADAEARLADKQPIDTVTIEVPTPTEPVVPLAAMYAALKAGPLAGGEDV